MKKILVAFMFGLMALGAHAEATFDQIQVLIEQQQYQAAEKGLEVIIQNHPKSAKAFYAMAQAQAGLGNQEKAKKALDIATGLNPTLDFAPASSVASLKQAITPQVKKIEAIEETHTVRNTILILFLIALGYVVYSIYRRNKEAEDDFKATETSTPPKGPAPTSPTTTTSPTKPTTIKEEYASSYTPRPAYRGTTQSVAPAPAPTYSAPPTTIVNNTSSGSDLLTGMVIGNMLSSSHHNEPTREVVRERVIEREVPSKSSTWDDTPSTPSRSSRSSSWDDDSSSSSSKKSSSWDDSSSSSSSSSSWDSGSSSSDSGSSSSWD